MGDLYGIMIEVAQEGLVMFVVCGIALRAGGRSPTRSRAKG